MADNGHLPLCFDDLGNLFAVEKKSAMSNPTPQIKIYLLGAFRVMLNDEIVAQFDADSARALLAYLLLHAGHAHQRTALANLFWCDQPAESSLHNLRSALNRVRKALNDSDDLAQPFILATRQTIQWNPKCEVWVDVLEFGRLLAMIKRHAHRRLTACPWCMQRLTHLAALYQGEFLADLQMESLPFEEWRQVEGEQLHRLAIQSFHLLADYYQQNRAFSEAEHYARRQLALERWNEEAHLQLMRALCATGQRSAALAQYEACRGILAAEFGVAPAPATTAFYAEIRQRSRPQKWQSALAFEQDDCVWLTQRNEFPNNLLPPSVPFVNRQAELDTLLQRLVNPANRLTTLIGQGGIGKTSLALMAARALVRSFEDGVWFVPLADLPATTDGQQAGTAILTQLCAIFKIETAADASLLQCVCDYLHNKELLLLLDNFEHLLASAPLLSKLLQASPNLTLLVTSRQPLRLQAEYLLRVSALAQNHAVQLFMTRAHTHCTEFVTTIEQITLIEAICSDLHGHPLAIELAAAEVRRRNLHEILTMVRQRPGEMRATHSDAPERHRSLGALFLHSWRFLTPPEQCALLSLAYHPSTMGGASHTGPALTADLLADLYDKSMLIQDSHSGYQIPALLRHFIQPTALLH
jgi:DNA-binding SARP family transcriptional activator